jgi:hypothetical protein
MESNAVDAGKPHWEIRVSTLSPPPHAPVSPQTRTTTNKKHLGLRPANLSQPSSELPVTPHAQSSDPPHSPSPDPPHSPSPEPRSSRTTLFGKGTDADRGAYRSMAGKEGDAAWSDGPGARPKWSVWTALGPFSTITTFGGPVVSLGVLSFLFFMWFGTETNTVWRDIMTKGLSTLLITICSAVLRIILAAQALIITGLIAALLLERYGVPIVHVAQVSILRSSNPGPWRLIPIMFSSSAFLRKVIVPFALLWIVFVAALITQFSSTILVSDLGVASLLGAPQTFPVGITLNLSNSRYDYPEVTILAPTYIPFGEKQGADMLKVNPTSQGYSDTGPVRRLYLPMAEANRTTLRTFEGKAHMYTSRFVCARPELNPDAPHGVLIAGDAIPNSGIDGLPMVGGNISFRATFENAGIPSPTNCTSGTCLDPIAHFNCTMPFQLPESQAIEPYAIQACYFDPANVFSTAINASGDNAVEPYSRVFLLFKSNFTATEVGAIQQNLTHNLQPLSNDTRKAEGEFYTWEFNGMHISASLCFQTIGFFLVDAQMTATHELAPPRGFFNTDTETWNHDGPINMFGYAADQAMHGSNASSRGLYDVISSGNISADITQSRLQQGTILFGIAQQGVLQRALLSPNALSTIDYHFHPETQALFTNVLQQTGRAVLAMDAMMTTVAKANIDNITPFLSNPREALLTPAVAVLVPVRARGLAIVAALVLANLLCVVAVTAMFLRWTRYSIHGNYWHVAAQIFSEETRWILDDSTEIDDEGVRRMMQRHRPGLASDSGAAAEDTRVKIGRSFSGSGRVQVVPYRRFRGGSS